MEIELFITYPSLLLTISIKNSGTCRILLIGLYFQVLIVKGKPVLNMHFHFRYKISIIDE